MRRETRQLLVVAVLRKARAGEGAGEEKCARGEKRRWRVSKTAGVSGEID